MRRAHEGELSRGGRDPRPTFHRLLRRSSFWLLFTLTAPATAAPQLPLPPVPTFAETTREAGIFFTYTWGDREMDNIVEGTGAGCSWLDIDGDGWLDLYLNQGAPHPAVSDLPAGATLPAGAPAASPPRNRLFRNHGDGTFRDVTDSSGTGDNRYSTAALPADYDNDGDTDLYVTNYGRNTLYRNEGQGVFRDVTEQAGVGDARYGLGGTWFDYDGDGDLDLFALNYLDFDKKYRLFYEADIFPGPLAYPPLPSVLYRNDGDGTFTDVTARSLAVQRHPVRGMGALAADFDGDGRLDLFVANDATQNLLLLGRGVADDGWQALENALLAGIAYSASGDAAASMGGDLGDVDGDGRLDLVVPDDKYNNVFLGRGGGTYQDKTAELGVAELSGQFWSWGVDLVDVELDGDLDLIFSAGHGHILEETQEAYLLVQVKDPTGRPRFLDAGRAAGPFWLRKRLGRGLCTADYDNDGDVDLFVLSLDQPSTLVRNEQRTSNGWLQVRLRGTTSNRDGLGAEVTVRTELQTQVAVRLNTSSFLSANDPRLHFGLGQAKRIEWVEVRWPTGRRQRVLAPPRNALLTVVEERP